MGRFIWREKKINARSSTDDRARARRSPRRVFAYRSTPSAPRARPRANRTSRMRNLERRIVERDSNGRLEMRWRRRRRDVYILRYSVPYIPERHREDPTPFFTHSPAPLPHPTSRTRESLGYASRGVRDSIVLLACMQTSRRDSRRAMRSLFRAAPLPTCPGSWTGMRFSRLLTLVLVRETIVEDRQLVYRSERFEFGSQLRLRHRFRNLADEELDCVDLLFAAGRWHGIDSIVCFCSRTTGVDLIHDLTT